MAVNKLYKFKRIDDATSFLNGCIKGGSVNSVGVSKQAGIQGLVGTTLIFTSPSAATVTFTAAASASSSGAPYVNQDPYLLLFKDIKAQIEAALTTVRVLLDAEQNLVIIEKTPASGVAIDDSGTANMLLGFDGSQATVGKLYKPSTISTTPPCWVWADSGNDNMISVFTWE